MTVSKSATWRIGCETIIEKKKQLEEVILGFYRLLSTVGTAEAIAISKHSRRVKNCETRDCIRIKQLVVSYWEFVGSIYVLVTKQRDKKPPLLALPHPRASLRAKENALEEIKEWNGTQCGEKARTQRKRQGFSTVRFSTAEFFGKMDFTGKVVQSTQEIQPLCFVFERLFKREWLSILASTWMVLFVTKWNDKLGSKCAFVLMIVGTSMWIAVYQIYGYDSRSSRYCMKNFQKVFLWSSNYQTCFLVAREMVWHVKNSSTKGKAAIDFQNTEAWQCSEIDRHSDRMSSLVPNLSSEVAEYLAVSLSDSSKCHERDGRCGHHSFLYARRRTCAQFTYWPTLFQCCHIGIGSR